VEPNSTQNLLDVKNLEVEFSTNRGVVKALNRVNLEVRFGETVGLVGESGAGKSVLGRSIMQLLSYPGRVSGGEIFWNGEDLLKRSEKQMCELRSDSIAMVFQDPMTA
jgi:ABC-type dipeptide/oligopeptide/nickel transport system ATPase component